jgi:5-enolpyruvylshikimate-3-phosphate synthase
MAFGILSAVSGNRIEIKNPEVVAVSYPRFWEDLRRVAA